MFHFLPNGHAAAANGGGGKRNEDAVLVENLPLTRVLRGAPQIGRSHLHVCALRSRTNRNHGDRGE